MNNDIIPKPIEVDTEDFTNKQKVIFLTISIKNILKRLRQAYKLKADVTKENEELLEYNADLKREVTELRGVVESKGKKIQYQKKKLKELRSRTNTQQNIIDAQSKFRNKK